jgi:hypothetical protein
MDNQDNFFALALKQADDTMASIDIQFNSVQAQLESLATKKSILIATRRALLIQLGDLPPDQTPLPQMSARTKSFKGMSLAAAARKYLFDIGRPQTHAQIVEGLLKGNARIASKRPGNSVRACMQEHPEWFRWVKRPGACGHWELVEWPTNDVAVAESSTPTLSLVQ